jgi:hypothetical protein
MTTESSPHHRAPPDTGPAQPRPPALAAASVAISSALSLPEVLRVVVPFLARPFAPDALLGKVREVLDAAPGPGRRRVRARPPRATAPSGPRRQLANRGPARYTESP